MCDKKWEHLDFDGFIAKFNEICNYQTDNQQFAYEYRNYIAYMDLKTKIGENIVRVRSFTTEVRTSEEQNSLKRNIEDKLSQLKNDAETCSCIRWPFRVLLENLSKNFRNESSVKFKCGFM